MALFGKSRSSGAEYLIVGLGNPGTSYELTRHNIGFRALDYISGKIGVEIKRLKHMGLCAKTEIGDIGVVLLKPQTYMNNSGESVRACADFYKIKPENVIVVYDDVAIPVGALRIRKSGSPGGHNGLKSVSLHLGTDDYIHIRLGVGAKPEGYDLADYVLGKMPPDDFSLVSANFDSVFKAVSLIINGNTDLAMSRYNKNVKTVKKDENE